MSYDKYKLYKAFISKPDDRTGRVEKIIASLEEDDYFYWIVNTLHSIGPDNWEYIATWLRKSGNNCFKWFYPGLPD